ncbi:MAG: glycosyltransferase family 2 protein [Sulfitobacter sp.]
MGKKASVIIPTYQSWSDLQLCLDLLGQQTTPVSEYEIVVVNNAADEDAPADLRVPPNCRIVTEPKPGSYAARNAGIAEATTDLLFFTDADCRPHRGYIEKGLRTFAERPDILRFAGAVELEAAGPEWTIPEIYDMMTCLRQDRYASQGRAATANVFVRRSAFEKVGLFDDEALSGGDMEWSRRAQAMGVELVYDPEVIVGHPARLTFEEHATKRRRILAAQIRNAGRKRTRYYLPPLKGFFPSFGILRRSLLDPDITTQQALKLWMFQYRLRRTVMMEQIKLMWFNGEPERR